MEVGDKKVKQEKNGIDYLIKQGYKKLSAKTFISDIDLEKFLNKDFTNINKTRALGFIQILEREYDVDLSELRSDYLDYEITHRPKKPETLFTESPVRVEKEWKKYLPYIAGVLAVLGLVYYLFRPTIESTQTPEPLEKELEKNRSVINEAVQNIVKLEVNENSNQQDKNVSVAPLETVDDDLDLDKVVLEMMQERNISASEYNITMDGNDSVDTVKKLETKQAEKVESKPVSKIAKVKKEPISKIVKVKNNPVREAQKVKIEPKKKKATKGEFYIQPSQRAWVGIIYLDNFRKKDFLIRKKLQLVSDRDQLIVVGHNKFKIYNKAYSVKFRSKGPVRFIYRDGELMEISKKEFKRTSAGVAW